MLAPCQQSIPNNISSRVDTKSLNPQFNLKYKGKIDKQTNKQAKFLLQEKVIYRDGFFCLILSKIQTEESSKIVRLHTPAKVEGISYRRKAAVNLT